MLFRNSSPLLSKLRKGAASGWRYHFQSFSSRVGMGFMSFVLRLTESKENCESITSCCRVKSNYIKCKLQSRVAFVFRQNGYPFSDKRQLKNQQFIENRKQKDQFLIYGAQHLTLRAESFVGRNFCDFTFTKIIQGFSSDQLDKEF